MSFKSLLQFSFLLLLLFACCIASQESTAEDNTVAEETVSDTTESEGKSEESGTEEAEKAVLTLTTSTFDDAIKEHDIILVEFFAPWCGHCKNLAPVYEKAAQVLKTNNPPVALAAVDATVEADLASKYDVSGYPTLKFFKKGVVHDYDGGRDEDGIVEYMKERADPAWKPPPEAVLTVTTENFDEVVMKEPLILVEFYAPWCGHCKKLAPEYEKAAKELKNHDPPIPLAKVDATKESELGTKYEVSGYPTLKIFRNGKPSEYKGERDQYGIVQYMIGQVGPSSKLLNTKKAVMDFVKDWEDIVIMGFFENEHDELLKTYLEANNDIRDDYRFGHTFDSDATKAFGFAKNTIALFHPEKFRSKYEDKYRVFKGESPKPEDLQQFYNDNLLPLVGQMTSANEVKRYKKRPFVVVFYGIDFTFEHRDGTQYWRNKVLEVANEFKDFTFAIADEEEFQQRLKDFGLDDSGEDVNVALVDEKERKYAMEDEFTEDNLRDFLEAFKNGELTPKIKSQAVPKSNPGPVQVVVGKTFEKIVFDSEKDVLIELYAPWCGHCKSLEPIYKKLAEKFKNEPNIVIAKIDATANDVPTEYVAAGFPTIFFAAAGNKMQPVKYEGARDLDNFVKFIKEKSTKITEKTKDEL